MPSKVPGAHFEGEHVALLQSAPPVPPVPARPLSPRGALRLCPGGRVPLRPQPGGAQSVDDAA